MFTTILCVKVLICPPSWGTCFKSWSQSTCLSQEANTPIGLEMLSVNEERPWWRSNRILNTHVPLAYVSVRYQSGQILALKRGWIKEAFNLVVCVYNCLLFVFVSREDVGRKGLYSVSVFLDIFCWKYFLTVNTVNTKPSCVSVDDGSSHSQASLRQIQS